MLSEYLARQRTLVHCIIHIAVSILVSDSTSPTANGHLVRMKYDNKFFPIDELKLKEVVSVNQCLSNLKQSLLTSNIFAVLDLIIDNKDERKKMKSLLKLEMIIR